MLTLKINGETVDLPNDFSVTMNLKSPIFNDPGNYSYPFRLPITPRNSIRIGFRQRVENTSNVYEDFDGELQWNGISLFSGTVKLKNLNSKIIEGYILDGSGDFNYRRKNTMLHELDFGVMEWAEEYFKMDYFNTLANKVYPETNIAFPQILNASFFSEPPTDPYYLNFNYYENGKIGGDYTPGQHAFGLIVPMLYLRFVLDKIFANSGYVLDDSFFSADADYNKLALFNVVDCNSSPTGYFTYDYRKLFLNFHVPRISLNDFFLGLETFFNLRLFVNNTTRTVKIISVDQIVKSNECTDFSKQVISISTEVEKEITGFTLSMAMDTDDDKWATVKENQESYLSHIKSPVQSISDLPPWPSSQELDIRFVKDENSYYMLWDFAWITSDYLDNISMYSEFVYKSDSEAIETQFSTLMHDPVDDENCIIGNTRNNWERVTPKLFFSLYQEDINSGINNKMVARNHLAEKNLFYFGEHGLMNKHYKAWFDFRMSTKLVKIVKQMSFAELKEFDFSKKYMINGTRYLVKSIQVVLKNDVIKPALLECYTCN